jgi:para-aminobenzoate synthetase component 1
MASLSPETFVVSDGKKIQTVPIKGTRPRYENPEQDRAAAAELLASEKDRAELLMIVDLERNDFGRICRTGSVSVTELATLRSYSNVHHLVAKVHGELRHPFEFSRSLAAIYPGGSITGAPKVASMRLLEQLEPLRREWFTGSLFWCGDDGSIDSSILIRTVQFTQDEALIGAGGGVVIDSEPEREWKESNHKVRGLTQTLGFDPQEAR